MTSKWFQEEMFVILTSKLVCLTPPSAVYFCFVEQLFTPQIHEICFFGVFFAHFIRTRRVKE